MCILHTDVDTLHVYIFVVYKYILYIFGFVVSEKNQTLEVRYYPVGQIVRLSKE